MRNTIVFLALCLSFLGLSVSAQVASEETPSTTQLSGVERRMVEIELEVQLKAYRKILMALYEAEIEWAVVQLDKTTSRDNRHAMQTRLALLENLKETAALNALKFEEQLRHSGDTSENGRNRDR